MITRDKQADIAWLERAIDETRKRIEWNTEHRWFEVVDGEWKDITESKNDEMEADIRKCEIMLEVNRAKL